MDTDSNSYGPPYRRLVTLAVVLGLALVVVSGIGVAQQADTPETPADTPETPDGTDTNETDGNETATLDFNDQESDGTTIAVDDVTLPRDGYVAIHNDSLLDGDAVGSVVGVTDYLEAGTYDDLTVELFDVPGAEFDESELTENATLIAMPHEETTGNETYDFVSSNGTDDGPFTEAGEPVTDDANISVVDETNDTDTSDNDTDGIDFPITPEDDDTDETDTPDDTDETDTPGEDTPTDDGT